MDADSDALIEIDPRTWPEAGRIGYCRGGNAAGCYFFLHLGTNERQPNEAFWQGFFQPLFVDREVDEEWTDNSSGYMQELVMHSKVEWAPFEVDAEAERRLFGLRDFWASRGSPTVTTPNDAYGGLTDERSSSARYGRVASPASLGLLIKSIRESSGRDVADVVSDPVLFNGPDAASVEDLESGTLDGIRTLIEVLTALDYDLAIAPKRGSLVLDDSDPWAEFR